MAYIDGEPFMSAAEAVMRLLAEHWPPQIYYEGDPLNPFWDAVKLVDVEDLSGWERFKKYEEHASPSYLDYMKEAQRVADLKREIRGLVAADKAIREKGIDEPVEYKTEFVTVPGSFWRRRVRVKLPAAEYEQTAHQASDGFEVVDGHLSGITKFRKQEVLVRYRCPTRVRHGSEIEQKKRWLEAQPKDDIAKLHDLETSWSRKSILFVSHRWSSAEHPDPNGKQLEKLRALKQFLIIYDYSSFPQECNTDKLALVLQNMTRLIKNVVVLGSDDYVERGWCLYEYLVASLRVSIVFDEINDDDFVQLRRWSATEAPANMSLKGHSFDSQIQNSISKGILEAVNRIRPRYVNSKFTINGDRETVTSLLTDMLLETLPSRREYPSPYLGEWVNKAWTREELQAAFRDDRRGQELEQAVAELDTSMMQATPNQVDIPTTIQAAALGKFTVQGRKRIGQWEAILGVFKGPLTALIARAEEWAKKSWLNRILLWLLVRSLVMGLLFFVGVGWVFEKLEGQKNSRRQSQDGTDGLSQR